MMGAVVNEEPPTTSPRLVAEPQSSCQGRPGPLQGRPGQPSQAGEVYASSEQAAPQATSVAPPEARLPGSCQGRPGPLQGRPGQPSQAAEANPLSEGDEPRATSVESPETGAPLLSDNLTEDRIVHTIDRPKREKCLPERYRVHSLVPIVSTRSKVSLSGDNKSDVPDSGKLYKASGCALQDLDFWTNELNDSWIFRTGIDGF